MFFGFGDDVVVVVVFDGCYVVMIDMMVYGLDFCLVWFSLCEFGWKVVVINFFDVVVMGVCLIVLVVVIVVFVDILVVILEGIVDGLCEVCVVFVFGCGVVGGDFLVLDIFVIVVIVFGDFEGCVLVLCLGV